MKKTVTVSIGGFSFIMEEEAYHRLERYLEAVKRNISDPNDAKEIIIDIEYRIAELFREALKSAGREVVDSAMVESVIGVMGAPEDFNDGATANAAGTNEEKVEYEYYEPNSNRSFFRNPDDKLLGGVCSGLSAYVGWDPLPMRIIFVLLFTVLIPVYIILWILIPEAKTTSEKLRMQGKPVTIKTIKKRFNDFKEDVESLGSKENQEKWRTKTSQFSSRIESAASGIGKIISRGVGLFLLIIGIVIFIGLFTWFVYGSTHFPETDIIYANEPFLLFHSETDYQVLIYGAIVFAIVAMFSLISSGIQLLFNLKFRKNKIINIVTGTIAGVAMLFIIYGGVKLGYNFSHDENITKTVHVPLKNNTIYISVDEDVYFSDHLNPHNIIEEELVIKKGNEIIFGYPDLEIKHSDDSTVILEIKRSSAGATAVRAAENAENIVYKFSVDSSLVNLSPVFRTLAKNKLRNQDVEIKLYVPENVKVISKRNLRRVLDIYESDITDKELERASEKHDTFIMTSEGLKPI